MNRNRALEQAEETLRAAVATAERAAARIQALQNRPEEPTTDDPDGALVIWFRRRFQAGTAYTYAAVNVNGRWYLSGPKMAAMPLTWDQLLDWLGDDLVGDIWKATELSPLGVNE